MDSKRKASEYWAKATKAKYWTDFRAVSNTFAARAVILVPLIGYWIIFNEQLLGLSRLFFDARDTGTAKHVPLRLFWTYFGLCLVAVASALYQWRCPDQVKMYATATEYVGIVYDNISGLEMLRVDVALQEGDDESRLMLERINATLARADDPRTIDTARAGAKRNSLQALYDLKNRSFPYTRRAVMWCYRLGFAALAVPSLEIFIRVVAVLSRTLARSVGV